MDTAILWDVAEGLVPVILMVALFRTVRLVARSSGDAVHPDSKVDVAIVFALMVCMYAFSSWKGLSRGAPLLLPIVYNLGRARAYSDTRTNPISPGPQPSSVDRSSPLKLR